MEQSMGGEDERMDKKQKSSVPEIKIKINGEERPFSERVAISNWQTAKRESAAAEEAADEESFEWVLPDVNSREVPEYEKINYAAPKKKSFPSQWKRPFNRNKASLLVSVILAIPVGLILGLLMLKMAIHTEEKPAAQQALAESPIQTEQKEGGSVGAVTRPEFTSAVLQGGAYSTEEAAKKESLDWQSKGFATVMLDLDGMKYLIIGAAGDIGTAKQWKEKLGNEGLDVMAKELVLGEKAYKTGSKTESQLAEGLGKSFNLLSKEVASGAVTGKVDGNSLAEIKGSLDKEKTEKWEDASLQHDYNALWTSYECLQRFQQSGDKKELAKAQQSLLTFLGSVPYRFKPAGE